MHVGFAEQVRFTLEGHGGLGDKLLPRAFSPWGTWGAWGSVPQKSLRLRGLCVKVSGSHARGLRRTRAIHLGGPWRAWRRTPGELLSPWGAWGAWRRRSSQVSAAPRALRECQWSSRTRASRNKGDSPWGAVEGLETGSRRSASHHGEHGEHGEHEAWSSPEVSAAPRALREGQWSSRTRASRNKGDSPWGPWRAWKRTPGEVLLTMGNMGSMVFLRSLCGSAGSA
jgi:hypothetical protein